MCKLTLTVVLLTYCPFKIILKKKKNILESGEMLDGQSYNVPVIMIDRSVLGVAVKFFFLKTQSGISIRDGNKNLILETILSVFFFFLV